MVGHIYQHTFTPVGTGRIFSGGHRPATAPRHGAGAIYGVCKPGARRARPAWKYIRQSGTCTRFANAAPESHRVAQKTPHCTQTSICPMRQVPLSEFAPVAFPRGVKVVEDFQRRGYQGVPDRLAVPRWIYLAGLQTCRTPEFHTAISGSLVSCHLAVTKIFQAYPPPQTVQPLRAA
jgi:hypothetical protein